ncbi:transposase [Microcoleus sp. T2B6]|uniref:transposase n=1 Tax=Microcoleus sp. T2B6 TaxID=3055424 RepID=UPI004040958F
MSKAAGQLEPVIAGLPQRPLVLFDREYGCASLVLQTGHLKADKLIRLRSNRCLYSAPPAYSGRGRPRRHGEKFQRGRPPRLGGLLRRWLN